MDYPDPEDFDDYNGVDADDYEAMLELERENEGVNSPDNANTNGSKSVDQNTEISQTTAAVQSRQKTQQALDSMSQDLFTQENTQKKKRKFDSLAATELQNFTQNNPHVHDFYNLEPTDIFGDIDDIIFEEQMRKKPKIDPKKAGLELIDKILELRRLYREQYDTSLRVARSSGKTASGKIRRDWANVVEGVPRWAFKRIEKSSGKSLYVRFHSELFVQEEIANVASINDFKGFIGDTYKPVWEEAHKIIGRMYTTKETEQDVEINPEPFIDESTQLWVEVYKPKKYLELLSDENTNRTLLHWVKLWDKVVFNRQPPKFTAPTPKFDSKWQNKQDAEFKLEPDGRPLHKVALLCGPPGLGKTTLAHMIARHAGYNVVEINASDDRNVDSFRDVLENATQMKSIIDQENRPNCIILDEIDGAPKTSIEFLIKFVNGTHKPKKTTKNKDAKGLKRPVICICNDVYAPALRNLRTMAFVVHFPPTASSRLGERLMEIARYQHVRTDIGALLALCDKTQNDIRACLSVLHFFKSQNKPVKLTDIHNTNIGQKNIQKGLFQIWNEIFQIQRIKPTEESGVLNVIPSLGQRMQQILRTVNCFGEYDKLIMGVFENYPQVNTIKDFQMESVCDGLDWFVFTDLMNRSIYSAQNFILLPYLQYSFVVWHFLFGTLGKPKLLYPNADFEASKKHMENESISRDLFQGTLPSIRIYIHTQSLILDILSYLLQIISPLMKSVNITLLNQAEKEELKHVVDVMIDYNITYIQERDENGTYKYRLDPNLDRLIYFRDEAPANVRQLSYSAKQLIAREVELEKMRRFEGKAIGTMNKVTRVVPVENQDDDISNTPVRSQNHLMKLQPKKLNEEVAKKVVVRDFFGRVIDPTTVAANSGNKRANQIVKGDIWYHYKEGYNNAVRKTIKMESFL